MQHLLGTNLKLVEHIKNVSFDYKNGSFLGFGGDQSGTYSVCSYADTKNGKLQYLIFIESGREIPQQMTISKDWQYGLENGMIFFVIHGNERKKHGIYQWRFMKAAGEIGLKKDIFIYTYGAIKENLKVDLSWIAGDALRDF